MTTHATLDRAPHPTTAPAHEPHVGNTAPYWEHRAALVTFVKHLVGGNIPNAEDIVQETMLRACQNADKLNPDRSGSLQPWLKTVAHRIVIDQHRRRAVRPQEASDEPLAHVPSPDRADATLDRHLLIQALQELTVPHRQAIVETYYRGRTAAEAAEHLGLPLGTVKTRMYYGMRTLRVALRKRGVISMTAAE